MYINIKSLTETECKAVEKLCSDDFQHKIFKFASKFVISILLRSKKRNILPNFIHILKFNINKSINNANWIIEEFHDINLLKELLIECPLGDMKKIVCGLLYCAMLKISKDSKDTSVLMSFINVLLTITYSKQDKIYEYINENSDLSFIYLLIWRFGSLGIIYQQYLVKKGIISFIFRNFQSSKGKLNTIKHMSYLNEGKDVDVKSIITKQSQSYFGLAKLKKMEKLNEIEINQERKLKEKVMNNINRNYLLLIILDILISYSTKPQKDLSDKLSKEENSFIKYDNKEFWRTLITEVQSHQDANLLTKLITTVIYNNIERINSVHSIIMDLLIELDANDIELILKIFKNFLFIEDNFFELKVNNTIKTNILTFISYRLSKASSNT